MRFYAILAFCAVFLVSCAKKDQNLSLQNYEQIDINASLDYQALQAFDALHSSNDIKALNLFYKLYKSTNSYLCLKEAFRLAFLLGDFRADELVNPLNKLSKNDNDALRLIISYYINNKKLNHAKNKALKLIKAEPKNSINYSILGTIYVLENNKTKALENFKKAFELEPNELNLLKLFDLFENVLKQRNLAINYLQDWLSKNGYTKQASELLLSVYVLKNNTNNTLRAYEKLYKSTNDLRFLGDVLNILLYKKDFKRAQILLETYGFNDEILLELYAHLKLFDKAYLLSQNLYEKSNDPSYKAKMAMFAYEKAGKKTTNFELEKIIELFEAGVYNADEAVFYNYYGYLLIDHNLNIKKGLKLVLKAYELDQNASYIIDSIAWGYYKLNNCKKAKEWMDKVVNDADFMKQDEAKEHKIAIDQCINKGKK